MWFQLTGKREGTHGGIVGGSHWQQVRSVQADMWQPMDSVLRA